MKQESETIAAPVRAIDRAFQVLLEISSSDDGLTAAELSQRTDLPLSTVYRVVDSLMVRGFVIEGFSAGRYAVGPTAQEVGSSYRGQEYLIDVATPVMEKLAAEAGETVNLAMIRAGSAVYVHQVDSPDKLMRMFMEHGVALPIHSSGVGKVLLAWADPDQSQRLRSGLNFHAFTPRTITNERQLDFSLEQIREQGYALDDEEREAGVRCVAVPVFRRGERVIAALSISGPTSRIATNRISQLVSQLKEGASEVSVLLN